MPSIAVTRRYEAVYILDPDSGEEQINAVTQKYRQLVETNGGAVEKVDVWERRKLAYEIQGRTEGIYVIMHFSGKPNVEAELRRVFQISEDQIRSMIVKAEETPPPASREGQAAPAAASARTVPAPAAPAPPVAEVQATEREDRGQSPDTAAVPDVTPSAAA